MKQLYSLFLFTILMSLASHSQVVINEIYGGGGNSGATYRNDFIELYNNGSTAVDLTGWSVQYGSATGSTWQVTNLSGTIQPHGYFLIQEAVGSGGTVSLTTPDVTGSISMSGTAGKVALVNVTTALTGSCPTGTMIIDFVGFGTTANCFEGSAPTPAPSNTNSVQRILSGTTAQDTNVNSADFVAGAPSPTSSGGTDVTAPTISSLQPATGATNIQASFTAVIIFSETIVKASTGTITVKKASDNSLVQTTAISAGTVVISGNTLTFDVSSLAFSTGYYIEITSDAIKDAANNFFAGISGSSTWNFTTAATPPTGTLSTTYSFATCSNSLTDGFTQYSVLGDQKWGCTTFGRDPANLPSGSLANGVQINGYSTTNVPNEDWLISPAFDLTATTYPLLSFWSRTKFNGEALHLEISTDYTGTGDPRLATWTELNGRFPNQTSDVWTLSDNINLSAFKQPKVFLAWVYLSSNEEGARWTLDDITLTNSATPPPPSITVNGSDVLFNYVAPGSTINKTIVVVGNDLTGPLAITAPAPFLVSKDGTTFSSSITYTAAEANNIPETITIQFAPTQVNKSYTAVLDIATAGATASLTLKGTTVDPANTLEVVNWNIEWFGSVSNGPTDDALQELNVKSVLQNTKADIYGLVEVVNESRLASIVSQMPGYSYVVGQFGSHVNPPDATGGPLSEAQKLAFVYKTSLFSNVSSRPMINNQVTTSASYNNWSGGRYPFLLKADVTLNAVTKTMNFILIHAKANTSPTTTSYNRRRDAVTELHDTLNTYFPNDNIILLGDFNDDLDSSITDGISPKITSYAAFTTDNVNFYSPTLSLSLAGKKSTAKYNDVIDHVIVSNELAGNVMQSSTTILTDVASLVTNYSTTTTDHYPVFTRYAFDPLILLPVKGLDFTAAKQGSSVNLHWTVTEEINNDKYIIERSNDGIQFTELGTLAAKANGNAKTFYNFTDATPQKGVNIYRLKQVDKGGRFEYSRQVPVIFDTDASITLSPNPAKTGLNVRVNGFTAPMELRLLNAAGKLVKVQTLDAAFEKVDVSTLSKGIYFVQVISNKQVVQSGKVVIER